VEYLLQINHYAHFLYIDLALESLTILDLLLAMLKVFGKRSTLGRVSAFQKH
jgi:hypothetical protein